MDLALAKTCVASASAFKTISDQCGHVGIIYDLSLMSARRYKTEMIHFMSLEWVLLLAITFLVPQICHPATPKQDFLQAGQIL